VKQIEATGGPRGGSSIADGLEGSVVKVIEATWGNPRSGMSDAAEREEAA